MVPLPLKAPTEGLMTLTVIVPSLETEAVHVPLSEPEYVPE
jgi:hypothetical protein